MVCIPKIPHVVVMANWLPEFKRMTADRWDVRAPRGEVDPNTGLYKDRSTLTLQRWNTTGPVPVVESAP